MKILLIDSSYLIYKSYFAYPNLTYNNAPVGAFFGYAKTILQLINTYKPDQLVIAGDTPKPTWRHKLVDDYKAGRAKMEDNLVSQLQLINEWAKSITSNFYMVEGFEADDVIFSISMEALTNMNSVSSSNAYNKSQSKTSNTIFDEDGGSTGIPNFPYNLKELISNSVDASNQILIYSSDRDLYQMLGLKNLKFLHGSKFGIEEFGAGEFSSKYELDPLQWLDYKALVGDNSDNLKGVEGIGPKTATNFLQQFGCLYSFCELTGLDKAPFVRTAGASWITKTDPKSAFENPKNTTLIEKLISNFEVIKHTYLMSSLQMVPSVKLQTNGYGVKNNLELLEMCGFKSLITMINKIDPQENESLFD
jgi:DNA polymerase I